VKTLRERFEERIRPLILLVALVGGCATAAPQSLPQTFTLPATPAPEACLTRCQALPLLGEDLSNWVIDLVSAAGDCLRLHETCRLLVTK
jgi:hypothetical protein